MGALIQQFKNDIDRNLTQEPTGFAHPEDVIVSYDSTTRKVTLTGDPRALWRGAPIEPLVSGWESASARGYESAHGFFTTTERDSFGSKRYGNLTR
jgi:hypothetical protein